MRMIFRLCVMTLGVFLLPGLLFVTLLIHYALASTEIASAPTEDELIAYAAANAIYRIESETNSATQPALTFKCE